MDKEELENVLLDFLLHSMQQIKTVVELIPVLHVIVLEMSINTRSDFWYPNIKY